jgi:quercetin dioxygenase-like cupin family protein
MSTCKKAASLAVALLYFAAADIRDVSAQTSTGPSHGTTGTRSHLAFSHALPRMDGGRLQAQIVEVNYGPSESSPVHSHPCPVIGYVIEGAVRMQVKGESEHIYKAGESFYEAPNGVHQVSANASDKEPAKFLAYFVCDHDTPLSIPAPEPK